MYILSKYGLSEVTVTAITGVYCLYVCLYIRKDQEELLDEDENSENTSCSTLLFAV
jgi:hypothetical protein